MYRMLIVDDEEIIVNGLYEIFGGMRELDLDVYKAYSGEEAIEWLERTRIDIVLTDIHMPGIDGMKLLSEIHRNWPRCRVIFLTGHSEFAYVYRAIQRPGVSYILKSEDHEKVVEAVRDAIRALQREVKTGDLIQQAKQQMDMARALFQSDYLLRLLRGSGASAVDPAEFEQLSIPMQPMEPALLLIGQADDVDPQLSYSARMRLLHSVRLLAAQYLGQLRNLAVMDERDRFCWFIQPAQMDADGYRRACSFLKGSLEAMQVACRDSLNASISFALSGEPVAWESASAKYYELAELLGYRVRGLDTLVIDTEAQVNLLRPDTEPELAEAEADAQPLEAMLRHRSLDQLELYLEQSDKRSFFEALLPVTDTLRQVRSKHSNLAIEAYCRVSLGLLSYINRWKLAEQLAFHIGQHKLMRIDAFDAWGEAADYLLELASILFELGEEGSLRRADNAVEQIQRYIEQHLDEDLSLVRLAERARLNPSYLSRLYKQVAGANLSDFIDAARMKRAKQLLKGSDMKIHEVARQAGYETAASFTRFFRKQAGISPQEYREGKQMQSK